MSDNNKDPFLKGAVWIGLLIMLPSAVYMFVILNTEAESFNLAPRWIVFSSILMFFNCGIVVGLMDSGFNDYRETWWLSYLQDMAGVSIPLIFLMLLIGCPSGQERVSSAVAFPSHFFPSVSTAQTKSSGELSLRFPLSS